MEIGNISGAPASGASISGVSDWAAFSGYYNTPPMELQFNTALGDGLPQLSIRLNSLAGSPALPKIVDWGDGTVEELIGLPQTHTYSTGGVYDVKLFGYGVFQSQDDMNTKLVQINKWVDTIELLSLNNSQQLTAINDSNPPVLSSGAGILLLANCPLLSVTSGINNWDTSSITSLSSACSQSSLFDADINGWDVSSVTDMGFMFLSAISFDGDISSWDVSSVTNMSHMFFGALAFNQDISGWVVSGVTDMSAMFFSATSFNQDISGWVVNGVTNTRDMFLGCSSFNQDISGWNVSSVTDMSRMFYNAILFDQDISGWDVSSVTDMFSMFRGASVFNQDISSWNVSGVTNMSEMFLGASAFDQNLGAWQFVNNTVSDLFFDGAGISDANVALCLEGWDSVGQGTGVDMSNMFGTAVSGGGPRTLSESTYPNAKSAYDNLIATYSWDLTNSITWVA